MVFQRVKTPCVGICSTGIGDQVCRGCKRFNHEVIQWNSYSNDQRRIIDQRLQGFLAQTIANKIEILDRSLLARQLKHQQIVFDLARNPYCWVYDLLNAGASQIDNLSDYGIKVLSQYSHLNFVDLRKLIDQDYYTLSCAYYDRYIGPGETA
jgi:predicted Fe-S protein YdhL (DUF1289 family)